MKIKPINGLILAKRFKEKKDSVLYVPEKEEKAKPTMRSVIDGGGDFLPEGKLFITTYYAGIGIDTETSLIKPEDVLATIELEGDMS